MAGSSILVEGGGQGLKVLISKHNGTLITDTSPNVYIGLKYRKDFKFKLILTKRLVGLIITLHFIQPTTYQHHPEQSYSENVCVR